MSQRAPIKSRVRLSNKSVFHLQDKKADDKELSIGLIKSAKRTGQLSLSNRGLGSGKFVIVIDNFDCMFFYISQASLT